MDDLIPLLIYLPPLLLIGGVYIYLQKRRDKANLTLLQEARESGLHEPASLHPVIDTTRCVGCGACVNACPEHDVLGLIQGKAQLIGAANCIGHGACQKACPVGAIDLVFGTATRGVDIPLIAADFQTSVPGIYIAGELGGMGLIRNAIEQGRQAMEAMVKALPKRSDAPLDAVIVGAGPSGLSAALAAKAAGIRYITLDQEATLGGTVAHFPRGKLVMTQPATLPLVGKVKLTETSKEHLLAFWDDVLQRHPLNMALGEQVQHIERTAGGFLVTTGNRQYQCHQVLLAIGRRGTPRKLNVPGEDASKVVYRLIDPEQYRGQAVLVVGGGDSALEAAISIADEQDTQVTLAYRGDSFNRAKAKNRERVQALVQAKKIDVFLNSSPATIEDKVVILQTPEGVKVIANDSVIICAGGELPTGFLKKIGINVETKYGTA
ncbi:MAG: NAD(P)-binding domain-containing protein [Gammaproteobacteria bacterium]|nr:NAD(P)-binding domain-containing protein [Gammaproteobacteria bacterium]